MQSKIETITNGKLGKTGKAGKIYKDLLANIDSCELPHVFIERTYNAYKEKHPDNPSINGRIFEYLLCEVLAAKDITPFYYQASFLNVPNVEFDILLYHPRQPVVLSAKTSLRERYKQADLEGWALRQVYRGAQIYLITLNQAEGKNISFKIKNGEVLGLDGCLLANNQEFTHLIQELQKNRYEAAQAINPIQKMSALVK